EDDERGERAAASERLEESFAASSKRTANLFLFNVNGETPDITILSQSPRRYHGRVQEMARELEGNTTGRTTLFVMPSLGLAERVREMLGEYEITAELLPSLNRRARESETRLASSRVVTVGKLTNGFAL